jgi:hypothetical protein
VPRHRLEFDPPSEAAFYALYGWEPFLGYWAELKSPGRRKPVAEYGSIYDGYHHDAPLLGLLQWLVKVGALDATGLDEALVAWGSTEPSRLSKQGRRALQVIETLKREAD